MPPETERRPVTETLHGVEIVDPYRWLEGDDETVQTWTDRQNEYADAVLDTPQQAVLSDRYESLAQVTEYGRVDPAGGRYFQLVGRPEDEQDVLTVADSLSAFRRDDRRVLYDPNGGDGTTAIGWAAPGPDGELVACGVDEGGREQYDVVVLDATTGETVETLPGVGRTNPGTFAWADDGVGFYYCATGSPEAGTQLDKEVRYHELGSDAADGTNADTADADGSTDTNANTADDDGSTGTNADGVDTADADADVVVADDFTEHEWPTLHTDGDALFVTVTEDWTRTELYGYRGPAGEATLEPILTGYDATFEIEVGGGRLFVSTDHEAPRYRVLATDVDRALSDDPPALSAFETVVPETEAVIQSVSAADDRLYVHRHRDATSELTVLLDGERRTVPLGGLVTVDAVEADDEGVFFRRQSFGEPQSVCRWTTGGGRETLTTRDVDVPFAVETSQEWFTAPDGTEIPAFVVRRADVEPDGTNPAVLTGYGGFRISRTPYFDRFRLPFLRAGGVFVVATLRGGGEYGEPWHDAGSGDQKHHTFEDAEAVADGLVDRGWAAADRLGVIGGSNGGLLVGALVTRDPDRFRAAVCRVPLLDMLRYHEFLLGESWTAEYGSPTDPDAFETLRSYSPYHNVGEAAYPATLFETALGDTRVHPAHARKTAARLQANNTGPHPVALRVAEDTGHGVGKPTSMIVREQSERWGFLVDQLGVDATALTTDD